MKEILRTIPIEQSTHVEYIVKLDPTEQQIEIFNRYFEICKYVYNLGIDLQEEYIKTHEGKYMRLIDLNNHFNYLKNNNPKYQWLSKRGLCDSTTMKLVLQDVVNAYEFERDPRRIKNHHPKKKDDSSNLQFPTRPERMNIDEYEIRIPSIGWVKYYNSYGDEIIGTGKNDRKDNKYKYIHYCNSRISFNGIDYTLSFTIPIDINYNINSYNKYAGNPEWQQKPYSRAIGIDVGLRRDKWMVDSTGYTLVRPSSDKEDKKIEILNQKLDRQSIANDNNSTKNIEKTKVEINKYYKKKTNRRRNEINNYANRLLNLKPEAVVMESIKVENIVMHNNEKDYTSHKKRLNNLIQEASLYDSMQIIENKLTANGIPVYHVPADYPSSQICSRCGHRYKIKDTDIYECPNCGLVINRDYNAALNLASQAYLKSVVQRPICPVIRLKSIVKKK